MPQPFNSVFARDEEHGATFSGSGTASDRPKLATRAAQIFAIATEIDTMQGDTLTAMLGADAEPAIAMYSVLRAAHIQNDALMAAAQVVLDERTLLAMEAVLQFVGSVMQHRHKLAHWHWGMSLNDADALLLLHPSKVRDFRRFMGDMIRRGYAKVSPDFLDEFTAHLDHVLVYREAELVEVIARFETARRSVSRLHNLITRDPLPTVAAKTRDELWQELLSEPELAEVMTHLESKRQNKA